MQPLLSFRLAQLQGDAEESIDRALFPAVLTGTDNPVVSGEHLPVPAAVSFAIDSRLFATFLRKVDEVDGSATDARGVGVKSIPVGGHVVHRGPSRIAIENAILGVLLSVLGRRNELPAMPASHRWPHELRASSGPPDETTQGNRHASYDAVRSRAVMRREEMAEAFDSLSPQLLKQARIGFRQFRALLLQLLQCEYEARSSGSGGDQAYLHPRGHVPLSFLPEPCALPHPPMQARTRAEVKVGRTVAAAPTVAAVTAAVSADSLLLQARMSMRFDAPTATKADLPDAALLPAPPFSYELPEVASEPDPTASVANIAMQLVATARTQTLESPRAVATVPQTSAVDPGRKPQRLARRDPVLWTVLEKPYESAPFFQYARRMSRLGISDAARAHLLGHFDGGYDLTRLLGAPPDADGSVHPSFSGGVAVLHDSHLVPTSSSLDAPSVIQRKCVASPMLWSLMVSLLGDEYVDSDWDARKHRPRIDFAGIWPPTSGMPIAGVSPDLSDPLSLPARIDDGISPYAACMRWAVGKLWALTVLYEPLRLRYAAQRVTSVARQHAEALGVILVNEASLPELLNAPATAPARSPRLDLSLPVIVCARNTGIVPVARVQIVDSNSSAVGTGRIQSSTTSLPSALSSRMAGSESASSPSLESSLLKPSASLDLPLADPGSRSSPRLSSSPRAGPGLSSELPGLSPRLQSVPVLPGAYGSSVPAVMPHFLDPQGLRFLQILRVGIDAAAAERTRVQIASEGAAAVRDAAAAQHRAEQLSQLEAAAAAAAASNGRRGRRRGSVAEFPSLPKSSTAQGVRLRRMSITALTAPGGAKAAVLTLPPQFADKPAAESAKAEPGDLEVEGAQGAARTAALRITDEVHRADAADSADPPVRVTFQGSSEDKTVNVRKEVGRCQQR